MCYGEKVAGEKAKRGKFLLSGTRLGISRKSRGNHAESEFSTMPK